MSTSTSPVSAHQTCVLSKSGKSEAAGIERLADERNAASIAVVARGAIPSLRGGATKDKCPYPAR